MKYLSLILVLICLLSSQTRAQFVCPYETNIDYYISVDLTYVLTSSAQFCCTICSLKPGCVGNNYYFF